jgi:GntR family transcriptional repressor for pyruvate dehydrogenase complex
MADGAMGRAWSPLSRDSLPEIIAKKVLNSIATHELAAGSRLPSERELAAQFRVGRPTVREALRILEAQGFLTIQQGRGTFVSDRSDKPGDGEWALDYTENYTLSDLFAMRRVLEVPAAAWAALRKDEIKLQEAEVILTLLDDEADKDPVDWDKVQELDSAFHLKIVEAAGNGFLSRTQNILQSMLAKGMKTTLQVPGRIEKSRVDHYQILEAIRQGDFKAAESATDSHITAARDVAFRELKKIAPRGASLPPTDDVVHPYTSAKWDPSIAGR